MVKNTAGPVATLNLGKFIKLVEFATCQPIFVLLLAVSDR